MILSDSSMKARLESGNLVVKTEEKYDIFSQIGPASLDFRLGNHFKVYKKNNTTHIDAKDPTTITNVETIVIEDDQPFVIHPGEFVLGVTKEYIEVPEDLVARCEGRSSMGRLGIILHSTAGYIDPGFAGTITLEMTNINEVPVVLYPGMRIGQFAFETIEWEVEVPYNKRKGSKYMGQTLPEPSRVNSDTH